MGTLHLTVGDHGFDFRHDSSHRFFDLEDVLYPVMDKKDLTVAPYLIEDGITDQLFIEAVYLGEDGITVGGGVWMMLRSRAPISEN